MKKLLFLVTVVALSLALCIGAFATTNKSLDGLYINEEVYNSGVYEFGLGQIGTIGEAASPELIITEGDKVYILGWFASNEAAVDRVVYRIDGDVEYECEDNYRDRTAIADVDPSVLPWVVDFKADDFIRAGFGKDEDMMELLGIGSLPVGEYDLEIVGKFTDDDEIILYYGTLYVEERELTVRDFNADTDKQYFDRILINGEIKAEGNDAVAELKANVDGSEGNITTIGMYGWFGLKDAETDYSTMLDSYGYIIDDGKPVFDKSFNLAEQSEPDVINGNGLRYQINVDVSALQDGQNHTIKGCAKLANGDLVIFNRENREAIINYKAPLKAEDPTEEPAAETPTAEPADDPTTEPVDEPTAEPVAEPDPTPEKAEKKGCGGVIGGGIALAAAAACALIIKKRR